MPHDTDTGPISAGDEVIMWLRVIHVSRDGRDCTMQAIDHADTGEDYLPIVSCATRLVQKAPELPPYEA